MLLTSYRIIICGFEKNSLRIIMETKKIQISESLPFGIMLALSGGCMDAYSYMYRGHVFANAQTGNMLLFGVNLANADFAAALIYLLPVVCFAAGLVISQIICSKKQFLSIHWKQISLSAEATMLVIVAILPHTADRAANVLTSFACGIQVESFRMIHDNNVATTMCIGNLRSGVFNISQYINTRERTYLKRAYLYFILIVAFIIGAIIESALINAIGELAILLSPILLIIALVYMFQAPLTFDGDKYI